MKRYVAEPGSPIVKDAISGSVVVATAVISRAEVGAALAKAVQMAVLTPEDGTRCVRSFREDWPSLLRLPVSEPVVSHADGLAWEFGLRGYDAVQLAAALHLRDLLATPVTMATFDRRLSEAAGRAGLRQLPENLGPGIA